MAEKKKERPVYTEGADTADAAAALSAAESAGVSPYESKYGGLIDEAAKKILNGEKFSYDIAADPVYASLREKAERNRRRAIDNAAASAAALTGGYGNSYGVTSAEAASAKIYDNLNGVIPSLLDAAYKRWQGERDAERDRLKALMSLEDSDYGRYRDSVSDAKDEKNYLLEKYSDLSKRDREIFASALNEYFKDRDYARAVFESDRDAAYRAERDAVQDAQKQKEYEIAYMKALAESALNNAKIESERAKAASASQSSPKKEETSLLSGMTSIAGKRYAEMIANMAAKDGEDSSLSAEFIDRIKKAKKDGRITSGEYDAFMDYARRVGFRNDDTGLLY